MNQLDRAVGPLEELERRQLVKMWSSSTAAFAYGAPIMTLDEHAQGKPYRKFPDQVDVRQWLQACDSQEDIICWKSRQNYCSHATHASSMWLCLFKQGRSVAYVAQDDEEGRAHIEERVKGMYEHLPDWFKARYEILQQKGVFAVERCEGEKWQSFIEPIPRGSRKLRSWTYSRIHWDEAAHNDLLEAGYRGALPTVQGKYDEEGNWHKGQIIFTTSADPHKFLINLTGDEHTDHKDFRDSLELVRRGALEVA